MLIFALVQAELATAENIPALAETEGVCLDFSTKPPNQPSVHNV